MYYSKTSDKMQIIETITLNIDGQEIKVNQLEDGTFQKPDYLKEMERRTIGFGDVQRASQSRPYGQGSTQDTSVDTRAITAPATAQARRWSGYHSSMAPSHEPIVVAMAPLDKTPWIIELTSELLDEWEVQLESN